MIKAGSSFRVSIVVVMLGAVAGVDPARPIGFTPGDGPIVHRAEPDQLLASLTPPVRAIFYYPWFPEAWKQGDVYPYTKYHPTLGLYDSSSPAIISEHISAMQHGDIQAGIASWWGRGSQTDLRMSLLLAGAAGTGFKWSLYYEPESLGDPSSSEIAADLDYIRDHYAGHPSYLRIGGAFVVFVYADAGDGCGMADRWQRASRLGGFIVLKVFPGYEECSSQPDSWHQYSPDTAEDDQAPYSFSISPGFWHVEEENPRFIRNLARWNQGVRRMMASRATFHLITTFNEWGEGTSVESAREWSSPSGYGRYLDALHNDAVRTHPPLRRLS